MAFGKQELVLVEAGEELLQKALWVEGETLSSGLEAIEPLAESHH